MPMPIIFKTGNFWDTKADIYINPVNTEGIADSDINKDFKSRYPSMFKEYVEYCQKKYIQPKKPLHHFYTKTKNSESLIKDGPIVINYPIKKDCIDFIQLR